MVGVDGSPGVPRIPRRDRVIAQCWGIMIYLPAYIIHLYHMNQLVEKLLLATVGAVALSKEKIDKIVKELVKRGEMSHQDGEAVVAEFMEKLEKGKKDFSANLTKTIHSVVKDLGIPTRKEFEALRKKVESLKK